MQYYPTCCRDSCVKQHNFNKLVLSAAGPNVSEAAAASLKGAHFGIWTTTPWTIPANLAVAVNDALDYCVVEVQVGSQGRAGQGRGAAAELLSFCSRAASCSSAMDGLAQLRRAKLSWTKAGVGFLFICVRLCHLQGDLPEGWGARRLVVAADLAGALAEKFAITLTTLCTVK